MKYSIVCISIVIFVFSSACKQQAESPYKITGQQQESLNIYILGIHPYKNPKAMLEAYYPIIQYLNEHLKDIEIHLEMSKDYADFEKKLYEKKFHFAIPNPYQAVESISKGYNIIAKMYPDDDFRGIIVARKDKNIKSVYDLKGQKVSFPSPTALAAAMMPKMMLHKKGLNPEKDIIPVYVGSQESSILNVYYNNSFAGATWPVPWRIWVKRYPDMAKEMEIVWQTETLPNCPIVVRKDVDKEIINKFLSVLDKMSSDKKAKIYFDNLEIEGFQRANNRIYEPVKAFVTNYKKTIGSVK